MPPPENLLAGPHPGPEVLAAFLDGRLTAAEMDALEPHVAACEACCAFLRGLPNDPMSLMLRETVAGPVGAVPADADAAAALTGHPRYHLLEPLGSGGMGTVYKARHLLMDRLVALKVIHRRLLRHPAAVERFRREAKAAAKLAHPNIVTAHDADRAGGCHFLVMEFIDGRSLAAVVADRGPLGVAEACGYARQAALGLQHAFEHGMVHRDVKPQNLMLTPRGQVKVLDFGLAQVGGDEPDAGPAAPGDTVVSTPAAALTRASTVLGTPDYMAPEQSADARAVDTRTDIYALGCTLYFLLAGRPPFPEGTPADKLAAHRGRSPPPLAAVPPGLARVVDRMLAKDPARRYQTPAAVAEALRPFAEPAPRRRYALLAAAGVAAVLTAGGILYRSAGRGDPSEVTDSPEPPLPPELAAAKQRIDSGLPRDPADPAVAAVRQALTDYRVQHPGFPESVYAARLMARVAWPVDALAPEKLTTEARSVAEDGDPEKTPAELVEVFGGGRMTHWSHVNCVAFSKDGKTLASGGVDCVVRLWDAATGRRRQVLTGHTSDVRAVVFNPAGDLLASGSVDGTVRLWDPATGRERHTCRHGSLVNSVAFAPGGRALYSEGLDGTVKIWDAAAGTELKAFRVFEHGQELRCAALSPDGRTLATGGWDGTVKLWDAATGKDSTPLGQHRDVVWALAFRPDGRAVASAGWDGVVKLWDVAGGREPKALAGVSGKMWSVAFDPDGKVLAGGDDYGNICLWDATTGEPRRTLRGQASELRGLAFGPRGETLASASWDGNVKLWDVATGTDRTPGRGPGAFLSGVAVSPDGRSVAASCQDGTVHVWDLVTGEGAVIFRCPPAVNRIAFSPDGRTLAAGCSDSTVRLWDVAARREVRKLSAGVDNWAVAFSPDGKTLAAAGRDGRTRLWDVATGEPGRPLDPHSGMIWAVAFRPDGKTLAAAGERGTVLFYDLATPAKPLILRVGESMLTDVTFSPDGRTSASARHDPGGDARAPEVVLWDVPNGRRRVTPSRILHDGTVQGVAFSPDGQKLASVGLDGVVRLWSPLSGREQRSIRIGPTRWDIRKVAFTPDGRHLVTANGNGTTYVLRLAALE